ncbi:MAG: AAA family ATPase [Lachnospiraceae bacterium]|nr:AAA family ATPase [Lachnospiraceae bacterium]
MGIYLNPGNDTFAEALASEIYVDKSGLISYANSVAGTKQKYICVSRPRRFGKSMAAEMLAAYYDRECDSKELFDKLEIAKDKSYQKNRNQYNVIFLNMQEFLSDSRNVSDMINRIEKSLLWELLEKYPDVRYFDSSHLTRTSMDIYKCVGVQFIFVIDEWDCIFREEKADKDGQKKYLDFLRSLFKDRIYVKLVYMTGILPIKKYGTHSALNMFDEFTMIEPRQLARFVGFTDRTYLQSKICNDSNAKWNFQ